MMNIHYTMAIIGSIAGCMSGLFGIGGGIIVTPLLVLFFPWLSGHKLAIASITGLSSAQGFFSSAISFSFHYKKHKPDFHLILIFALPMAISNFLTSLYSLLLSEKIILFIFGLLGLTSLLITFCVRQPLQVLMRHPKIFLPVIGLLLGILCGAVGQGGGFIYLPIITYLFGVPIKEAVATSAAIGIISASGALFGRLHGDLSFMYYLPELIVGIFVGSYVGSRFIVDPIVQPNNYLN